MSYRKYLKKQAQLVGVKYKLFESNKSIETKLVKAYTDSICREEVRYD